MPEMSPTMTSGPAFAKQVCALDRGARSTATPAARSAPRRRRRGLPDAMGKRLQDAVLAGIGGLGQRSRARSSQSRRRSVRIAGDFRVRSGLGAPLRFFLQGSARRLGLVPRAPEAPSHGILPETREGSSKAQETSGEG